MSEPLNLFIIAGEPSGDRLGGALMQGLAAETSDAVRFQGIGGRDMTAEGLLSLFDMGELSIMGLSEVLPRLPSLIRRIRQTVEAVIAARPDALITIDSPDFTLRVAKKARKALPDLKVIHYVAPSVWAWRPGRATKMARHVDHVLTLLPFEPPYMEAAGMTAEFVGHPVAAQPAPTRDGIAAWREAATIYPAQKILLVAPGSRQGEVRRLGPVFLDTARRMLKADPGLAVVVPAAETVATEVAATFAPLGEALRMVPPMASTNEKRTAFAAADAALCASGTVTLELAATGTPMVAAYRTTWLTSQIVRRVIRVNTANLINLISGKSVVPEFLQEFCTVDALADALAPLLNDPAAASAQREVFHDVMAEMGRDGLAPGHRAARSVLACLRGEVQLSGIEPGAAAPGPHNRHRGRLG